MSAARDGPYTGREPIDKSLITLATVLPYGLAHLVDNPLTPPEAILALQDEIATGIPSRSLKCSAWESCRVQVI